MNETMKIMLAVAAVFAAGFILVGTSKQQSTQEIEAASMIRNYVAIQTMANDKCPVAIKEATKEQVYFPTETKSDKETYITLIWEGENANKGGFKKAACTVKASLGGISELIIDDKEVIKSKF
jgi:hypothetical protein